MLRVITITHDYDEFMNAMANQRRSDESLMKNTRVSLFSHHKQQSADLRPMYNGAFTPDMNEALCASDLHVKTHPVARFE